MEQNKSLGLLSLARKGGNIVLGEEQAGAAARASRARLMLLASDAGGQAVHQRTHGLLGLVWVAFCSHGNAFELDRLARRKQDGLSYPFQLRLFHVLPFPPAFCKSGCSDRRRRPPA